MTVNSDEFFMREALKEARKALEQDEAPVGAVVVCRERIIARAHNLQERLTDATAHAEMQAITAASSFLGSKVLEECTLYVTVEPCAMCAGAAYWARVGRLVYGASDPKRGYTVFNAALLHPRTEVSYGILREECGKLMSEFFKQKRPPAVY